MIRFFFLAWGPEYLPLNNLNGLARRSLETNALVGYYLPRRYFVLCLV